MIHDIPAFSWRCAGDGNEMLVSIVCPGCHQWHSLYGYEIDGNGEVSPHIQCDQLKQAFHVKLIGWKA